MRAAFVHAQVVKKRPLRTMDDASLGLGRPTIMDAALAARHGVRYVHLAAFAIDLDRLMEIAEDEELELPFGFEVFMIEMALLSALDVDEEDDLALIEDASVSIFERLDPDEEPPLGASLLFAVHDALFRGELPERLSALFTGWESGPSELSKELEPLFIDPDLEAAAIARVCLELELSPPLAPPTREALSAMVELENNDEEGSPSNDAAQDAENDTENDAENHEGENAQ